MKKSKLRGLIKEEIQKEISKPVRAQHLGNIESRVALTKSFRSMLGDFFEFMKALDKGLPEKAKNNPDMKMDVVHLMELKKPMLDAMDAWMEFLIEMDSKYQ
jgi:hypothetical protein